MYAVIQWKLDLLHFVIRLKTIQKPRKEEVHYAEGETVWCKWKGQDLEAIVVRISGKLIALGDHVFPFVK
jgi:hypothetical protein